MGYQDSLISRWDMSDINPPDLGFRVLGNDGTGNGLVAATDIVQGVHGKSMATEFNGADEWIDVATAASLNFGAAQDFSLALWMRTITDFTGLEVLLGKRAANVYYYLYMLAGDQITFGVSDGTDVATAQSDAAVNDGQWHHVVGSADRDGLARLFVDGRLQVDVASMVLVGDIDTVSSLSFGRRPDANLSYYAGILDDVRIYNIALTNLQATDLYVASRQGRL